MNSGVIPALEGLCNQLAQLPGVKTCRIGLGANIGPDNAGRVRLEKLYAALLGMDLVIRSAVETSGGQCFETVLDEDRLDTYKLMALKVRVVV